MTDADTIATLRSQIAAKDARIAELGRELNMAKYGHPDFAWSIHVEAMDQLRAENERLREALSLTVRTDDLREVYHSLPNDRNRIGDKRSRKSHARDAWLRAFRKAAKEARAALQRKAGE